MKVVEISKKKFLNLKPLELDPKLFHTEGDIYLFPQKSNWQIEEKLLKKLYTVFGPVFSNKLATVNSLIDSKDDINIDELVLPEKLVTVNGEIIGFIMPFIPSDNLDTILHNPNIPNDFKIKYLKEVGTILRKMQITRSKGIKDFFLNDIHEGNFIINKETGKVNAIDLDSASINGNMPFCSKYLFPSGILTSLSSKYKISQKPCTGSFIPDENSDLYCYNIMILNFLLGNNITRLDLTTFYDYLSYLKDIGINSELVDIFASLYTYKDNSNPDYLLDSVEPLIEKTNYYNFTKKR